uniref:Uncharacterized protein n=1 Tax=Panagrolaimus superbus TaxID=310955 RepID=A0A914Y3F0_9BILA
MSHAAFKEITHFTVIEMPEPIYSLPPWWPKEEIRGYNGESERSSIYPAGFLPSAPSEASTTDVASLSNISIKEEASNNSIAESSHSFAFSPSMTLPSTIQFPVTPTIPFPSSLYVNCPSLASPKKRKFSDFFNENKAVKIMLLSCFIFTVILILALIIYFILLVISVRSHEY